MSSPDPAAPPPRAPAPRPYESTSIPARGFGKHLRRLMDTIHQASTRRPDGRLRRRAFYPLFALRVLAQVIRQWARDRCPQQAASLAFQSALSIVPLIAIGLALLRATGAFEAQSTLVEVLSKQVLPVSRDEISAQLVAWADNVNFRTAGVAGVVMMLVLSFIMFNSTERIFNDIWRVERRRSLGQKFVVFYAIATIVPALMGVSLLHAARYGLTSGLVGAAGALAATFAALLCANKLLPTRRVEWRAAAIGALLSAVAFEVAKHAFHLYVANVAFQKYSGVYGTLGLLPILLIWIYYSWLVILLGAEVAHSLQNLSDLERLDRRRYQSPELELVEMMNGVVAARLMCAVVDAWNKGKTATARDSLAARFDVSVDIVDRIFRRLKERGLVIEVQGEAEGYLPARPPAQITLAEVFAPFRGADLLTASPRSSARTRLDEVIAELELHSRDKLRSVTLEELAS